MASGRSRVCLLVLAALLLATRTHSVHAHAGSAALWHVVLSAAEARSHVLLPLDDVQRLAPDVAAQGGRVAVARLGAFGDAILRHFVVLQNGSAVPAQVADARVLSSGLVEMQLRHRLDPGDGSVALRATFHELTDDTHRVIARVEDVRRDATERRRDRAAPLLFDAATSEHVVSLEPLASWRDVIAPARSTRAMILLGIEHILTGYDHLVFLACLLVPGGTWRSRVAIVSAFTAAHSATLVLAATRMVTPPPQFVELAIAVSIAYVAVENLLGGHRLSRWPTAFGFGLIHGFGFASMIDLLELPVGQWMAAVLAFNLGVEIGQLAVVAVALPIIIVLARSDWHRRVVQCTSVIVFGFAVAWFVERLP